MPSIDVRVKSNSMMHPKFRSFVNLIGASNEHQEDSKQLSDKGNNINSLEQMEAQV